MSASNNAVETFKKWDAHVKSLMAPIYAAREEIRLNLTGALCAHSQMNDAERQTPYAIVFVELIHKAIELLDEGDDEGAKTLVNASEMFTEGATDKGLEVLAASLKLARLVKM